MGALLTADQAAQRLGISERTLRKLRQRGDIPYVPVTERLIRYDEADCEVARIRTIREQGAWHK